MGPRIFGIIALHAPVVAVVRRGPTDLMHLSRWDLETPAYEPGAWLRGTIYPQRCDLSPDGRWFAYFALKASAEWELGPTYIVISRLPWLAALAAWTSRISANSARSANASGCACRAPTPSRSNVVAPGPRRRIRHPGRTMTRGTSGAATAS